MRNTSSRGASNVRDRFTRRAAPTGASLPALRTSLHLILHLRHHQPAPVEALFPELAALPHPFDLLVERLRAQHAHALPPLLPLLDELGTLEVSQMLGDRLLRDVKWPG